MSMKASWLPVYSCQQITDFQRIYPWRHQNLTDIILTDTNDENEDAKCQD